MPSGQYSNKVHPIGKSTSALLFDVPTRHSCRVDARPAQPVLAPRERWDWRRERCRRRRGGPYIAIPKGPGLS